MLTKRETLYIAGAAVGAAEKRRDRVTRYRINTRKGTQTKARQSADNTMNIHVWINKGMHMNNSLQSTYIYLRLEQTTNKVNKTKHKQTENVFHFVYPKTLETLEITTIADVTSQTYSRLDLVKYFLPIDNDVPSQSILGTHFLARDNSSMIDPDTIWNVIGVAWV